jgi:hypothetical protein
LQICDRLSFQHFLGLTRADKIPDARTIWLFGEELRCANVERKLFERFQEALAGKGLIAKARILLTERLSKFPSNAIVADKFITNVRGHVILITNITRVIFFRPPGVNVFVRFFVRILRIRESRLS